MQEFPSSQWRFSARFPDTVPYLKSFRKRRLVSLWQEFIFTARWDAATRLTFEILPNAGENREALLNSIGETHRGTVTCRQPPSFNSLFFPNLGIGQELVAQPCKVVESDRILRVLSPRLVHLDLGPHSTFTFCPRFRGLKRAMSASFTVVHHFVRVNPVKSDTSTLLTFQILASRELLKKHLGLNGLFEYVCSGLTWERHWSSLNASSTFC
jgi:hypothetical protein